MSDTVTVEMRYPQTEELKELAGTQEHADIYSVSANCIDKIYMDDVVYEREDTTQEDRLEFIENLTSDALRVSETFLTLCPRWKTP